LLGEKSEIEMKEYNEYQSAGFFRQKERAG